MNKHTRGLYASLLRIVLLILSLLEVAQIAPAQTRSSPPPPSSAQPTRQARPTTSLERRFLKNIFGDQAAIWTSPLRLHGSDAKWLILLGAGTTALIATDRHTAGAVDYGGSLPSVSRNISRIGSGYATGGVAAAFYLIGRARHDERAKETGLLAGEALIDASLVGQGLKLITQRPRPYNDGGRGRFFTGGNSFPSGHSIGAWSVATVIAQEYGVHHPLVRFGAYGLAAAVSLSRFSGHNHFLSDALIGSAIGYGVGRYVYFKHHDTNLDSVNAQSPGNFTPRSKMLPLVAPYMESAGRRRSRNYGLALTWSF